MVFPGAGWCRQVQTIEGGTPRCASKAAFDPHKTERGLARRRSRCRTEATDRVGPRGVRLNKMSSDALLWSLSETARQLGGLSVRTVRRMLARGELPTVKVGRTVKIPASAVREWVGRNMASADAWQGAGKAVRGQEKYISLSARRDGTKKGASNVPTRRTGGPRSWTNAADQLAVVLGLGSSTTGARNESRQSVHIGPSKRR